MADTSFHSKLCEKELRFIKFKQDFGHEYKTQIYYLMDFDRFCLEFYPEKESLEKEMVMKWAVIRPTETSAGYVSRISLIRQFGKFLCMMGEKAFILPTGLKGGDTPLMPYVFSKDALCRFFKYTDSMEPYYQSTVRHLVAPAMFRFMYCCGLRPREARDLDRRDVNLDSGRVFIKESKHYKERIIYAPDDLMDYMQGYIKRLEAIFPCRVSLFVGWNGEKLSYDSQKYLFKYCQTASGITANGTKSPNLYSFRHTFATHRIYQWYREGKELGAYLPRLSAYMGHNNYEHTLYYLHFIPEIFSEMTGFDFEQFSSLIPEVPEDD